MATVHPPVLRLTPFSIKPYLDFDEVKVGESASRKLLLENPKESFCEVQISPGSSGTFQLIGSAADFKIEPQSRTEIAIEWTPKVSGQFFEILRIRASTVKSEIMVKLVGTSITPPQPRMNLLDRMITKPSTGSRASHQKYGNVNHHSTIKMRSVKNKGRQSAGKRVETPRPDFIHAKKRIMPAETPAGMRHLTGLMVSSPNSSCSVNAGTKTYVKRRSIQCSKRESATRHNKTFVVKKQIFKDCGESDPSASLCADDNPEQQNSSGLTMIPAFSSQSEIDISPISKPVPSEHSLTSHRQPSQEDKDLSTLLSSSSFANLRIQQQHEDEPVSKISLTEAGSPKQSEISSTSFSTDEVRHVIISEIRQQFQEQLEIIRKEISNLSLRPPPSPRKGKSEEAVGQRSVATWTESVNFVETIAEKGRFPPLEIVTVQEKEMPRPQTVSKLNKLPSSVAVSSSQPKVNSAGCDSVAMNLRRKKMAGKFYGLK